MLAAMFLCLGTTDSPAPLGLERVSISPRAELPGKRSEFLVDGAKWVLFVPDSWSSGPKTDLAVHFHSAEWHAIQEHIDRGLKDPLIAFYPGEGSAIYARSVSGPGHFGRLMDALKSELFKHGFPSEGVIAKIDITSFSAGYGAVREWVKQPEVFAKMRRVILGDSLYGSLLEGPERVPDPAHILVWEPLARTAISGEKEFLISVSEVKTPTYASSSECAHALVKAVGGTMAPIDSGRGMFPLRSVFDQGKFHVWQYGGDDGQAHMAHARHLAVFWKALDR